MIKKIQSHWLLLIIIASLFTIATDSKRLMLISQSMENFAKAYRIANKQYVDPTDANQLMRVAIDSMLSHMDPYTNYFSEAQMVQLKMGAKGGWDGIGVELKTIDKKAVIKEIVEESPAEKQQLQVGDVIQKIDGTEIDLDKQSIEAISQTLQGKAGTNVSVQVFRPSTQKTETLTIERAKVTKKNVPYFGMLNDSTGYIVLTTFSQHAGANVEEALNTLQEDFNPKQVILDLRNNGGGFLIEAVNICNLFVEKGSLIVYTRNKTAKGDCPFSTTNPIVDGRIPLIVLINEKSASASEIVAGALQDLDRAVLLGRNSFGKGLVQNTKDIGYSSKVKLTTAQYYIPSGRCVQALDYKNGKPVSIPDSLRQAFKTKNGRIVFDGRGLEPDYKVEKAEDPLVLAALEKENVIFDFANNYKTKHDSIGEAKTFEITAADYDAFVQLASPIWEQYKTATEKTLDKLEKQVKELNNSDDLNAKIALARKDITAHKKKAFTTHQVKIKQALEQEIVGRYYYMTGQVENRLARDKEVLEAINLFADKKKFKALLTPKSE